MSEILKKYNEGLQLIEQKKYGEAEEYYRKLLDERDEWYKINANYLIKEKISPIREKSKWAKEELNLYNGLAMEIPVMVGKILLQSNQMEKAEIYLKETCSKYIANIQLHQLLINLMQHVKRLEEAEVLFSKLLKKNYNSLPLHETMIDIYLKESKLDKAEPLINKVITHYPSHAMAWLYRGFLLHQKKDLTGSVDAFQKVTSYNPKLDIGWENLGSVLLQRNELTKSEKCFQKALSLNQNNSKSVYNLAIIKRAQNNIPQALIYFEQALQMVPNARIFWNGYVETLEMVGDFPKLKQAYLKVLKLPLSQEEKQEIQKKLSAI